MDRIRAEFEKPFPIPLGTRWDEMYQAYVPKSYGAETNARADEHQARWEGWDSAFQVLKPEGEDR